MVLPVVLVHCTLCNKIFTPNNGMNLVLSCKCNQKFQFLSRYFDRGEWLGWEGKYKNWYVTSDKDEISRLYNKK